MILTHDELTLVRLNLEEHAGLDRQLVKRCGELIRMGAFDEAVRSAFVLLEEQLRAQSDKEGLTGTQLANYAFGVAGPLTKRLGRTPDEREGLRELFSGAFKLFRNPAAHGVVGFSSAEGKSLIYLVNLLLGILARAGEPLAEDVLPPNVLKAIGDVDAAQGPAIMNRLQAFLVKCVKAGLNPAASTKSWIPFRIHARVNRGSAARARLAYVPVFYLTVDKNVGFWFPVNQHYSNIVDFELEPLKGELKSLGFLQRGQNQDYAMDLRVRNDPAFFERLLAVTLGCIQQIEALAQPR